MFNNMYKFQFL